jgi:hypothetical protein
MYPKVICLLFLIVLSVTPTAQAQNESDAEEVVTLSPFEVSTEKDRGYSSVSAARVATPLVDPASSQFPAPVAVSIIKRADAVAVQFVLSHKADKQEVRNQELYASVTAIEAAVKNLPGVRMEQREVRFTGGDRKFFSMTKGTSTVSFVNILLLADLPAGVRVVDRVKQVHDILASTKLVGQTKYSDGSVGLYIKNPDQYRREILQKIFDDIEYLRKGFGETFEVQPSGLNRKVNLRVAGEGELELWIEYNFSFKSIRELTAPKKN